MIVCQTLYSLYGRDTRAAQWLGLLAAVVWGTMLMLGHYKVVNIFFPSAVVASAPSIAYFCLAAAVFALIGLFSGSGRVHQISKAFGLIIGSLTQAIIANCYVNSYPPLEMMLFANIALSLWLFGAVWYILRCEGKDGLHCRKP